eukprot:620395-Rhodomonas_salina.1
MGPSAAVYEGLSESLTAQPKHATGSARAKREPASALDVECMTLPQVQVPGQDSAGDTLAQAS